MAFICLGMLFAPRRLTDILALLPDDRRQSLCECMTGTSGCSAAERSGQLAALWRTDILEAARRCGQDGHMQGKSLPASLERWFYSQAWESDGS